MGKSKVKCHKCKNNIPTEDEVFVRSSFIYDIECYASLFPTWIEGLSENDLVDILLAAGKKNLGSFYVTVVGNPIQFLVSSNPISESLYSVKSTKEEVLNTLKKIRALV